MIRDLFHFGLALCLASCSPRPEKLIIATAANVQFAMDGLVKEFASESGIPCEIILGSSGKLTAQIMAGAPYDVFVSADMKYPQELHAAGKTTDKPEVYAYGLLVLWTVREDIEPELDMLNDDRVMHVAIANPRTAPYGEAAREALVNYRLYEKVAGKLVYGESIAQVNQFILSGTAEAGFTSKSMVLSGEMQNKGRWTEVDRTLYSPIAQGAVIIRREGKDPAHAEDFYNFLYSENAQDILKNSGYLAKP
ncbi:MAG TPA: molybdate ABC transporter substrate-binding protein [Cyclobacteriaceae bacterium]|nr:molybdate ABC transporter substrate-binding protein [Cyclobacteriaceae bacterium]